MPCTRRPRARCSPAERAPIAGNLRSRPWRIYPASALERQASWAILGSGMIKAQRQIKAVRKPEGRAAANPTLALARKVLAIEAEAVHALIERLDERFLAAVDLIRRRSGRVIVSGIGKSGHIARKIASTLSSTGTPAYLDRKSTRLNSSHQIISYAVF